MSLRSPRRASSCDAMRASRAITTLAGIQENPPRNANARLRSSTARPLASLDSRRRLPRAAETVTGQHRLQVAWARSDDELREAQRLRYRVFSDEMGARLSGPAGLDVDAVRRLLRSPARARSRHAESGRHVSRVAAASGRAHRAAVRGKRIRRVASHALAAEARRSGPLVRASRLSQRRRHHVAVGRGSPRT